MHKSLRVIFIVTFLLSVLLAGCKAAAPAATPETVADGDKLVIYAPASASSIPVIIAASKLPDAELTLYTDQSQANTLFLRGDVDILVSGLSVGVDMYKNDAPVQMVNSFVSGLSYLVTYGIHASSLADLKGQQIYIPFEGSPIDEVTEFLATKSGLKYKQDLIPVYAPFDSSIQMLKDGQTTAVVLPEPNVTLVASVPNVYISFSYFDAWNAATGTTNGYPQVGTFVNSTWAAEHGDQISAFNSALGNAILATQTDAATAVNSVKDQYKMSSELLLQSLGRTRYNLLSGQEMVDAVNNYYQVIGKPLDEKYSAFYYLAAK